MDPSDTTHTRRTQTDAPESNHWLDQLLENRYRELFGEDYLFEDLPELQTKKINRLTVSSIPIDIQYKKAMAAYQREIEAEVTQYQVGSTISFPPTVQCVKATDLEECLELSIDPVEAIEIVGAPDNVTISEGTRPQISNRKRKKEEWKHRRNIARTSTKRTK